jgi:ABC-type sugar transport system ATPase subunit
MLPFRPRGNEDVAGLSLRSVKKSFGEVEVVHGVDLEIADREFVVFVGPSGCGKSTLLRMIAGLEDITAGEIASTAASSTSSIPRTGTSPWCSRTTRSTRT